MLRYRESLGLLPPGAEAPGRHRRYDEEDLAAARWATAVEQRYGVPPQALAFAVRAVCDTQVAADVGRLGELTGRLTPATQALDFDQVKAQRLLRDVSGQLIGRSRGGVAGGR
jgi:DNA-binding transcriptional MerR regulator